MLASGLHTLIHTHLHFHTHVGTHTQTTKETLGIIHFSDENDPIFVIFDYKISNYILSTLKQS